MTEKNCIFVPNYQVVNLPPLAVIQCYGQAVLIIKIMAKYVVKVIETKSKHEMTFFAQEKKDAVDFANYYRSKNSTKDKKYEVKMKSL